MRDETVQYNGDDPAPDGSPDGTANSGIPEPSSDEAETMPHATPRSPAGGSALHVRCPHCHNPIELLPDAQLESLQCPSCGSDFSLFDDEAAGTRDARGVTQVGHFKLVERVGMGAFGSVWKALDTQLDRTVAVKIPRAGQLTPKQQEQFVREARAAAQLRHPNIVPVHEVGREGDTLYIVSDFVRGLTLADWLTGQRPTMRESAELCVVVAEALHHAHEQGVVHRDLKPGNIMLDEEGQPYLMDFGLAKRDAGEITVTQEGNVLGTPAYMAPEQARGDSHTADRRADVYSLGVILFQLLTGELPFRGNQRMLIHQVIHDEPPSPRKLNSAVPRDLETITLKCLEKAPEKRYASAEALGEELGRWLRGEPIKARPISATERAWRWARREPAVVGLSGTIALMLLVASVAGFVVARQQAFYAILAEKSAKAAVAAQGLAELEASSARHAQAAQQAATYSAVREKKRAEKATIFLKDAFQRGSSWGGDGPNTPIDQLLVKIAERARTEFADDPETRGDLLLAIGKAMQSWTAVHDARTVLGEASTLLDQKYGRLHDKSLEAIDGLAAVSWNSDLWTDVISRFSERYGPKHPSTLHVKLQRAAQAVDSRHVDQAIAWL